jgi:uncharacterized protein (DUF362 family)
MIYNSTMVQINRRQFLACSAAPLAAAPAETPRIGFVPSTHSKLRRPSALSDPLDYSRVRDMVWKSIEYAGGFSQRIAPGSWVVVKPNIVFLRPHSGYRPGDITDLRVTKAVVEYVARNSRAGRITVAEGGSYRSVEDKDDRNAVKQNGVRVDAGTFDWGPDEFPGFDGSLNGMLKTLSREFPGRRFDYVDLAYDTVRDAHGEFRRIYVPEAPNGQGAFGERPDYFVTRTITGCDFLVSVPVMKIHLQCGITACLKNYVGTAPREAYNPRNGAFHNHFLHADHSLEGRIDSFITDLAAFHPPDFCVVDAIQGLQYQEHNTGMADQAVRSNAIVAGRDPVRTDAFLAKLMGFNPWDIDFLHMAQKRQMGVMDLSRVQVNGDDPDSHIRVWGKPRDWWGRCNREWRIASDPTAPVAAWRRIETPGDTLRFPRYFDRPAPEYAAAVRVLSDGATKAYLWLGARGKVLVLLNGQQVMQEENATRYRIGQFQAPVELRSGENLLVFCIKPAAGEPLLSAILCGRRNDGDSMEGIRWIA